MLITLASAKGSPGTTTTALALGLAWPRPALIVEADLSGGSIMTGAFRGQFPNTKGLIPLVAEGLSVDMVRHQSVTYTRDTLHVLPGLASPVQANALRNMWSDVSAVLSAIATSGTDVIVDMGRTQATFDDRAVLFHEADLNIVTVSSRLPDIFLTRALAEHMPSDSTLAELAPTRLLIIGPGRPYSKKEIVKSIRLPELGTIAWDPSNAEHLSVGTPPTRNFRSSPLMKSAIAAQSAIDERVTDRLNALGHTPRS